MNLVKDEGLSELKDLFAFLFNLCQYPPEFTKLFVQRQLWKEEDGCVMNAEITKIWEETGASGTVRGSCLKSDRGGKVGVGLKKLGEFWQQFILVYVLFAFDQKLIKSCTYASQPPGIF